MTLWGGRFSEGPDDVLWRFTVDRSDERLLLADIIGSVAHVTMLGEVGLLQPAEVEKIQDALDKIAREAERGKFVFKPADEDVHAAVERRLGELIGPLAGKLHTGRSRNDQVATDLRLYLHSAVGERIDQLLGLIETLIAVAERVGDAVIPGYTHLQQAQAVPLAHHILAYAWMATRDVERLDCAAGRLEVSPLGAGALGGSSLPLAPEVSAAALGIGDVFSNSIDAVADRDFVAEHVFCCTQAMAHLSRLAEELILWSSTEFGWVTFPDALTTGSSMLPHKKNPDIAELVRGRAATVIGDLTAILALQKGLPLAYNRDLQEDKRIVFHADDTLAGALEAVTALLAGAEFHPPAPSSWVTAIDLAEALVLRGVPFRQAHQAVGGLVAGLVAEGRTLAGVTAQDLVAAHPRFQPEDAGLTDPAASVARRVTPGGGSMGSVEAQITVLRQFVAGDEEPVAGDP